MAEQIAVTAGNEEYLEWIYRLSKEKSTVNPLDLARTLKVSPASVTAMLKRLSAASLIEYQPYQRITLTERGREIAMRMVRRHALLERLMTDILGLPWEKADELACQLEHYVDEEVDERLATLLGNPTTCPHGRQIDLESPDHTCPLTEVSLGEEVEIAYVSDERSDLLGYLATLGLRPGVRVRLTHQAPFNGPLTLRVGEVSHAVGREAAEKVRVHLLPTTADEPASSSE